MSKYIVRHEAIRLIVEAVDDGLATTSKDLREILEDMPAAEVELVRYAHLIYTGVRDIGFCSACGGDNPMHNRYCGWCGAKIA